MFRVLSKNDIQFWADRFLDALERPPATVSGFEMLPTTAAR
jgi:trehalose-6-phosphate synthase